MGIPAALLLLLSLFFRRRNRKLEGLIQAYVNINEFNGFVWGAWNNRMLIEKGME
ncbi:MAG: hypothetical protein JWQ84_2100 [Mucilaginibacter sp.]|nr:hypothetical protein [Mucilaginibacter sp.]